MASPADSLSSAQLVCVVVPCPFREYLLAPWLRQDEGGASIVINPLEDTSGFGKDLILLPSPSSSLAAPRLLQGPCACCSLCQDRQGCLRLLKIPAPLQPLLGSLSPPRASPSNRRCCSRSLGPAAAAANLWSLALLLPFFRDPVLTICTSKDLELPLASLDPSRFSAKIFEIPLVCTDMPNLALR